MSPTRIAAVLVCVGVALSIAGCGEQESGFASIPDSPEQFPGPLRGDTMVAMQEIDFDPQTARVAAGSTVTWVNRDRVGHTVTDGTITYNEFDSGEIQPGNRYRRTFREPGDITYRCTIHANMAGALRVE